MAQAVVVSSYSRIRMHQAHVYWMPYRKWVPKAVVISVM